MSELNTKYMQVFCNAVDYFDIQFTENQNEVISVIMLQKNYICALYNKSRSKSHV
jgi:hypothetical protein